MQYSASKYSLLNFFPLTDINDCMKKKLELSEITSVKIYKAEKKVSVSIEPCEIISRQDMDNIEQRIKNAYRINTLEIKIKYKIPFNADTYYENIKYHLIKKYPICRVLLAMSRCEHQSEKLIITLGCRGKHLLNEKNCSNLVSKLIENEFSINLPVVFEEEHSTVHLPKRPDILVNTVRPIPKPQASTSRSSTPASVIMGKTITGSITPIKNINSESGKIVLSGEVFNVVFKEIKGNRYILSMDITDYTNSITVKAFIPKEKYQDMSMSIKNEIHLMVQGEVQYDKFIKETVVFAKNIMIANGVQIRQDTAEQKRVELHLHTQMSSMDGVSTVSSLVKRAAYWGHPSIAITDHGVVQAFPEAYSAGKKNKIKILYGVECYLVDDQPGDTPEQVKKSKSYHAVIFAKNYTGLKNLYKLISISHLDYFYRKPRMPKSLYTAHSEGLILGSACEAGELYKAILNGADSDKIEQIVKFYDYLEIQPLKNNMFLVHNEKVRNIEHLKEINTLITKLGQQYNKPVVATCDVHFLDERDEVFRRILMKGQGFKDADNQAPLYLRTTNEMLEEFSYLGEQKAYEVVVTNTNKISDMIEDIIPIPEETFPPEIEGAEQEIQDLSYGRAKEIYGENPPKIVVDRMTKELNSIIKHGFSVMYIIAQKLVSKSLSDGYLVGSRGSVGSSLIAFLTGITEVNALPPHYVCPQCKHSEFITDGSAQCGADMPDKSCPMCGAKLNKDGHDIPFETFLGFDGDKEPDIDLNFSGEYQATAHKYTEELFGEGHVFRAGTIGTIAEKTAFGFVKKYLDEKNMVLNGAEITRLVKGCSGVKRTTGQHPGGVMIVPKKNDIYEFCPIQRPADDTDSEIITTHFDYHSISGRLLKLDILGHDDPTVIKMLEDLTGIDARFIPIDDRATMSLFTSTKALGISSSDINSTVGTFAIPEFGTRFVRQMLVDTKPTTFSELVRISGLSHGTDVWLNNAQDLVLAGTATLAEVICTRDDIMVYLMHKGVESKMAFKIMESVRKGKGLTEEYEQAMMEKDVPGWYIESCKKILYMFPKAHAVAYVTMAFRIAYFKVHYPLDFYIAYYTVRADDFDAAIMIHGVDRVKNKISELEMRGNDITAKEKNVLTILEVCMEMYARGINFIPIDIYKSDAVRFIKTEQGILPPLNALSGLGIAAAKSIVEARGNGTFLSVEELRARAKVSKTVIEVLAENGCLKDLPDSSQISFNFEI